MSVHHHHHSTGNLAGHHPHAPASAVGPKARALPPGAAGHSFRRPDVGGNDANNMCKLLTDTMRLIHDRSEGKCSFQQLHTAGYQLCQHQQGALLYTKVTEAIEQQIQEQNELVKSSKDHAFLQTLGDQWKRHLVTSDKSSQMLTFFNKNYCMIDGRLTTKQLATKLFGDILLKDPTNLDRFKNQVMDVVLRERLGELVPQRTLLRQLSDMMVEVDHRGLFEVLIEEPFLSLSRDFYRSEAADLIGCTSTPQFVLKFLQRHGEEKERVHRYLEDATLSKICAVLREEFLEPHKERLLSSNSGVSHMLSTWRLEDLHNLFITFSFANDVPKLVEYVKGFFLHEGDAIVLDANVCQQPVQFVEKLIALKTKMDELVKEVFVKGPGAPAHKYVEKEMNAAFQTIVNKNTSTPDYLSLYMDKHIRSHADESVLEESSENVMSIFKYLQEKDLFEGSYKHHLSRRLLSSKPGAGEELEVIMIQKLKKECGNSMTNKIEGMFSDRRVSTEINESFLAHLSRSNATLGIDMSTTVLTLGYWPPTENIACRLPMEMDRAMQAFKTYYLSRFKNKRLEFSTALGTVDIRMAHNKKRFEINVPSVCAHPLLMFEKEGAVLTPLDISQQLGMEMSETMKAIAALIRNAATHSPLLKQSTANGAPAPAPSSGGHVLQPSSQLVFNKDFKSRHAKIKVAAVTINKDRDGAVKDLREKVDEDRKYKVDAAIVRVMKSRRTLGHQELVQEVQKVTKERFVPTLEEIKRRIEHLIEREFIERSPDSRSTYNYLA